jgi:anti-sigma B factor antagonist
VSRAQFELHTSPTNGDPTATEVTVIGEVDASNVADFTQALQELPGPRPLILHLSQVRYIDSAGFAALDPQLADKTILLVMTPDSLMYRAAELMCMPVHRSADDARRALKERGND